MTFADCRLSVERNLDAGSGPGDRAVEVLGYLGIFVAFCLVITGLFMIAALINKYPEGASFVSKVALFFAIPIALLGYVFDVTALYCLAFCWFVLFLGVWGKLNE